jgi:hypothetical protein
MGRPMKPAVAIIVLLLPVTAFSPESHFEHRR